MAANGLPRLGRGKYSRKMIGEKDQRRERGIAFFEGMEGKWDCPGTNQIRVSFLIKEYTGF